MKSRRDLGLAYVILILGGLVGAHKFYLNRPVMGIIYILTGGLFLIGVLVDVFTLPGQVERCNAELAWEGAAYSPLLPGYGYRCSSNATLVEATRRLERLSQRLENLETLRAAQYRS